jgi:uncharacterized protein (DUF305 family)
MQSDRAHRERKVRLILAAALAVAAAACHRAGEAPPLVQPGAPGQPNRVLRAQQAADLSQIPHTAAEIEFMQQMVGHHAQALEMTALVPARSSREDMLLLGKRIEISQADEIQMMTEWLTMRGLPAPDPHAHHAPGAQLMPGMLTPEEMQRLSDAKGAEFDRLFLELMIKHHEGAVTMVENLFATAGAGQQSDTYAFATEVDTDQRMEIDRMSAMLKERQK